MGEAGAIGSFQLGRRRGSDFINWEGERVPQREDRGFFLGGGDALWGARPLVFVQGSLQLRLLEGTVRQPVWLYSLLDHVCKRGDVWRHQKPDKTF